MFLFEEKYPAYLTVSGKSRLMTWIFHCKGLIPRKLNYVRLIMSRQSIEDWWLMTYVLNE